MPEFRYFHVDAFADRPMMGNQAAVMPMDEFEPDDTLLAIAAENNFSETAYIVRTGEDSWDLRWFTPTIEAPLCGHATLASAHVLFNHLGFNGEEIQFDTRASGRLSVRKIEDGSLQMTFPAHMPQRVETPPGLAVALGAEPTEVWSGPFMLAVFEDEETVRHLQPDIRAIGRITAGVEGDQGNLICAAIGDHEHDVVSRFFGPGSGIDEDPATGSAHCMLTPLFAQKLGKQDMACFQAFPGRGAVVNVCLDGENVKLTGKAVTVVEGMFYL